MEKPIIFSTPMVRAILDGSKTQTRRVAKVTSADCKDGFVTPLPGFVPRRIKGHLSYCPYGHPGDTLWVREKFRLFDSREECSCYDQCFCHINHNHPIYYADTLDDESKWIPPIYLPRRFSRINLLITGIALERIQDISRADAKSEGFLPGLNGLEKWAGKNYGNAQLAFRACWDSIHAKKGHVWKTNPWVWVIKFKSSMWSMAWNDEEEWDLRARGLK